jgi:hypothetical protein
MGHSQASEFYAAYEDGIDSVSKRRHIKSRRQEITHSEHGEIFKLRETSACRMSHKARWWQSCTLFLSFYGNLHL